MIDRYTALYLAGFGIITFDGVMLGQSLPLALLIAIGILLVIYGLEHLYAHTVHQEGRPQ